MKGRKERTKESITWVERVPSPGESQQAEWQYDLNFFYSMLSERPGEWARLFVRNRNYATVAAYRLRDRHKDVEAVSRNGAIFARKREII